MLKWIAIFLMTLDHIGHYLSPFLSHESYALLRLLGRLAFPIFAWQLAIGFRYTRNLCLYALRLLALGFVSEVLFRHFRSPLDLHSKPNILFTLVLGLVFITAYEMAVNSWRDRLIRMQPIEEGGSREKAPWQFRFNSGFRVAPLLGMTLGSIFMVLSLLVAWDFKTDYGIYGVLSCFLFHLVEQEAPQNRRNAAIMNLGMFNLLWICSSYFLREYHLLSPGILDCSSIQGFAACAVYLIYGLPEKRRDRKPPLWQKYFFYVYYPLHIVLLLLLHQYLKFGHLIF